MLPILFVCCSKINLKLKLKQVTVTLTRRRTDYKTADTADHALTHFPTLFDQNFGLPKGREIRGTKADSRQ